MSCLQREQAVFEKPLSALGKDRTDLSRSQLLKIHLSFLPHLPQAHPTASLKAGPSEDLFLLPPVSQFTCLFFFFLLCNFCLPSFTGSFPTTRLKSLSSKAKQNGFSLLSLSLLPYGFPNLYSGSIYLRCLYFFTTTHFAKQYSLAPSPISLTKLVLLGSPGSPVIPWPYCQHPWPAWPPLRRLTTCSFLKLSSPLTSPVSCFSCYANK